MHTLIHLFTKFCWPNWSSWNTEKEWAEFGEPWQEQQVRSCKKCGVLDRRIIEEF